MAWVNEIRTRGVDISFGGHKQSGLGIEHGFEGRVLSDRPAVFAQSDRSACGVVGEHLV
ncbi:hypothetical protein [Paraburkholderia sprentiae]|uniref:hypothetical protein n=1 Tax=Paraburkholderia sprentiae TaxID=948107 RepID=UPI0004050471|nr:hypothetical protein [Paraburkholderia sprentiae]